MTTAQLRIRWREPVTKRYALAWSELYQPVRRYDVLDLIQTAARILRLPLTARDRGRPNPNTRPLHTIIRSLSIWRAVNRKHVSSVRLRGAVNITAVRMSRYEPALSVIRPTD